jgi:anaerobic ribonucleoside-triphosphate reductase activating protein
MRVNYILPESKANGPGIRYTIWVQGCSINCPGCSNTDTWDPAKGTDRSVDWLIEDILKHKPNIEGVTITGGEPLDQFDEVYELCARLWSLTSIFLTTGYGAEDITKKGFKKIYDKLDIICIGPFEQDKVCSGEWKGSSNQGVLFLTDIGRDLSKLPVIMKEIYLDESGKALETGFTQ